MFGPFDDVRPVVGEHVEKTGLPVRNRDLHVLQAAHLSVDAGGLEGAQKAEPGDFLHPQLRDFLTFEADRARVDRMISDARGEQGGLAGYVGPDECRAAAAWLGWGKLAG